jgi:hypothetical protein
VVFCQEIGDKDNKINDKRFTNKGGLRRKNTPEKQKTATKPQGQERKGRLAFEELKKRT